MNIRTNRTPGVAVCATVLIGFAAAGCGGASLKLQADREVISAGGCDSAVITATLTIDGKPKNGKVVSFETTAGSFSAVDEVTYVDVTTSDGGKATVELFGTTAVGTASVTASFSDDNFSDSKSVSVTFDPPFGRFAPVSDRLTLECDAENVGAMRTGSPEVKVGCLFRAETAEGCSLPLSAFVGTDNLILQAEAGTLEAFADPWTYETTLIYRTSGGNSAPLDVDPVQGEPQRAGPLGETFNPRDGVVTVLVAVLGREGFTDVNGNGTYEQSEPFDDIAEPFVDADDDGVFTLGTDPYFTDSDDDGVHTVANGAYDATTFVGVSTKIVWTGDLEEHAEAARLELSGSADIPNGGSLTVSIHLLDARLNPISGFEQAGDYIAFNLVSGYVVLTPSAGTSPLIGGSAITWDEYGRYQEYHPDVAVYEVTLADDSSSWVYDPAESWSLEIELYSSPGPDGEGSFLPYQQYNFEQTLLGTSR